MKRIFLTLILALTTPSWASVCEDEIKPVMAIVRILKSSLRLGELTPEQIEEALLGEEIGSPFSSTDRDVKNLSFRNTFEKHRLRLRPEHLKSLRVRVSTLLKNHREQQVKVDEAKEQTKYIFSVTKSNRLPVRQSSTGVTRGTLDGRPVFIAKYFDGNTLSLRMIDPKNPDPTKRLIQLGDNLDEEDATGGGWFFSLGGREHFMRYHQSTVYDLHTGKQVPFPFKPVPQEETLFLGLRYLSAEQRIVATWYEREARELSGRTMSWNVAGAIPKLEVSEDMPPRNSTSLYVSQSEGRHVVGILPKNDMTTMVFTEYTNAPKLLAKVKLDEPLQFLEDGSPVTYLQNGRWYALAVIYDKLEYRLVQIDLQNGIQHRISVPGLNVSNTASFHLAVVNGQPVAVLNAASRLMILKLKDLKVMWQSEDHINHYEFFQWREKTYLIYSTLDGGKIHIRTLPDGHLLTASQIPNAYVNEIFVFEQDGFPKALAMLGQGNEPIFINLLHAEDK